jgi:LL-diaminopimelate aminotransferase
VKFNPLLQSLKTYPMVEMTRRKEALIEAGRPVFDFSLGDPDEPTPPFIRETIRAAIPEVPCYPTARGPRSLRASIAGYMRRRFGVALDPQTQVLPTSGSKEAVFHMPLLVIDPFAEDRGVIFPDPGYPAYQRGALFAGGEPLPVLLSGDFHMRAWELPAETLRRARMMWINSPHNPTGAVMSRADLRRTWEVCQAHDILLVNDECYADIYQTNVPPSLLEVATEGVLVLHSLSKRSGMTGYRSGFIAGDPVAIEALHDLRTNPGLAAQDFVNAGAEVAWADDEHAEARRAVFAEKKALMCAFFNEIGIEVIASEATFYLWLRCADGDDEAWALRLLEHGIVVTPGSSLGVAGAGAGYVRVALVPTLEDCQEAIRAWRAAHGA